MALKQVIIVRTDLKLPKGKLAAQVAHASIDAALRGSRDKLEDWRRQGMKKIVLKVENLSGLEDLQQKARAAKLSNSMITDAGLTVVDPGTVTALGIGPDDEEKLDKLTGKLAML
jgi:peptidyl-tRNA hydrolase, PTH2 family